MKVRKNALVGLVILLAGLTIGGAGGYFLRNASINEAKLNQQSAKQPTKDPEKNLFDGSSLTLPEMYESLGKSSDDEFDWKMLVYLLSIYNNETGMLKQAETKAKHPELKELAKILREKNEKAIPLMNTWQKEWGYSHH